MVKIIRGRMIVEFTDERLKSDLALSTSLQPNVINDIARVVTAKLSKHTLPIYATEITSTAHYTMIEMGLRDEADRYVAFVQDRYERSRIPRDKITYIKCEYCSTSNGCENKFCVGCGRPLDKDKTKSKLV
jgi:hypothetical protein